ncbi:retinol dehydrogenase 12 [Sporormia fimetaria CBS 119925]|uniref:Retinol dehydrogenase 12 n=1 Tax=Sporormia fimetaria CBS 119925 TaxID=1340428 RepID=A0A6A6V5G2_9PLEO|nr:retinol dehydrogenase 12 [Sporormia fimetaria CBS 119925]
MSSTSSFSRDYIGAIAPVGIIGYHLLFGEARDPTTMGATNSFVPARDIPDLSGKVILVTGGNTGLGKATITYLASHSPSKIYLAARTASKATSAISDIKSTIPDAQIEHLPLDLTSFASISSAASTFKSRETRLDILINNAGVMATPYTLTSDGYEIQLGTNHMGHALLTKLLLPTMLSTAQLPGSDVRIVNVSSMGHYGAPSGGIIFSQPELEKYNTWRRYGVSKLANILYTKELARRYPEIMSTSVHPGVILTDLYASARKNFVLKLGLWVYALLVPILPGHFRSPEGGALTQTWAATVGRERLRNGEFYRPVGVVSRGSGYARDEGLAKKLWEWTEGELEKHGF